MPSFRIHGDVLIAFIHTIEADTQEEAERLVKLLRTNTLNTLDSEYVEIHDCIELDKNGDELEQHE